MCIPLNLILFGLQGGFLSLVNLIILATILFHEVLRNRKEFIILAALALADALLGLGYVFACLGRLIIIGIGQADELRSRWQCFWTPWNQFFLWADVSGALMLLVGSFDRFLAVSVPFKYFKFTKKYGLAWAGSVFGFTALCTVVATVLAFDHNEAQYPATCAYIFGLDPIYYKFNGNMRIFGGVGSVIVTGMVLVVFMVKQKTIVSPNNQLSSRQNKRNEINADVKMQRKLTKTVVISSIFTMVFYVLPLVIEIVVIPLNLVHGDNLSTFLSYIYIINNVNPTANFFIYTLRHNEIKKGVILMLKCKQMSLMEFKKGQGVTRVATKKPRN